MRRKEKKKKTIWSSLQWGHYIVGFLAVLVACYVVVLPICYGLSATRAVIQVKHKEREIKGVGGSARGKYMIYSSKEVFECTDSLVFFKWNSSDVYREIKVGGEYECKIAGWRIPLLSVYRNILRIEQRRDSKKTSKTALFMVLSKRYSTVEAVTSQLPSQVFKDIQALLSCLKE